MMKTVGRISTPFLAYVLLLIGFAALGAFVVTVATGSDVTAVLGGVVVASLGGSVLGFRAAARKLAQSKAATASTSAVSIFSTPLRQDQIDRYLRMYRGERRTVPPANSVLTLLAGGQSTGLDVPRKRAHAKGAGVLSELSA